ncbi:hypothetical protein QQF64_024376 [Cirrhinus molitorella]|uniref:Uncharacterized protein n=1 Tax=Cirrhinus molitorella TaxID=172907 RepID=A0ABR3NLZ6_9TELE
MRVEAHVSTYPVTILDEELYARLHQDTCGRPSPASHFSSGIRSPSISPRHLLFSSPPPSIRPTLPSRKMIIKQEPRERERERKKEGGTGEKKRRRKKSGRVTEEKMCCRASGLDVVCQSRQ